MSSRSIRKRKGREMKVTEKGYYVATYQNRFMDKKKWHREIVYIYITDQRVLRVGQSTIFSPKNFEFHYGPLLDGDGGLILKEEKVEEKT